MTGFSVCVLGSSHTAALKQAWTNRPYATRDDFSMTFFAARSLMLGNLHCRDGVLIPTKPELREMIMYTSGGEDRIEIGKYDAFVLVALGFNIDATELGGGGIVEHLKWGPVETLMSHSLFNAVTRASLETSLSMKLAETIRSISDRPILVCPRPFPSEAVLDGEPYRGDARFRDVAFLETIMMHGKSAALEVSRNRSCELIWQDDSTTRLPGFTKAEFGQAPLRLKSGGGKQRLERTSTNHMNEDYGAGTLTAVLHRLDVLSRGRVLAKPATGRSPVQAKDALTAK